MHAIRAAAIGLAAVLFMASVAADAALCPSTCPSGYADQGTACAKPAPYGSGSGYPWKMGDGTNETAMLRRCVAANPGGCESQGSIAYPICKAGFRRTGCCTCTPECPSGMTDSGKTCLKTATNAPTCPSS